MLNSMTESSFSFLFSRSSSSCNKTPTSEGLREKGLLVLREGVADAAPKQELPYHLCLFHCAWEAVQEEPILAGRGVQVVLNQLYHHLITHLQR